MKPPAARPPSPSVPRRSPALGLAGACALSLLAGGADAHLSIIRQGKESAGAIESGDRFGAGLAVGDFDGDGFEDLATGAPDEFLTGLFNVDHGAVIVNYGSSVGLTHEGVDLLLPNANIATTLLDMRFGHALASADFDQDGYDDLAVGVPYAARGGVAESGAVLIYYGSPTGVSASGAIVIDQSGNGGSIETGDHYGWSLATGDLDLDGYPDLVIGSPGEDGDAGAVFYRYGSDAGVVNVNSGWMKQSTFGATNDGGDRYGHSVAVAQLRGFLGLNPREIAAGAPGKDFAGLFGGPDLGCVYVTPGSLTQGALGANTVQHSNLSLFLTATWGGNGELGRSLAVGRFSSGFETLAVGRPGFDGDRGEVLLLKGGTFGVTLDGRLRSSDFGGANDPGDRYGEALASGDWTASGWDDLAVGQPGHDLPSVANAGRVTMYEGFSSGLQSAFADGPYDMTQLGDTPFPNDGFGTAVAFGRFDDSGRAGLAVGVPDRDVIVAPSLLVDAGQVHVIAPWRQPLGLHCRTSIAVDCGGDIVFTQKPFEEVRIASTTKTMTLLIAAERSRLPASDPKHVSLTDTYVVPAWVDGIGGSQFGLIPGERMSLFNLMAMMMAVSGNDCAYAIADMLYGGPTDGLVSLPLFANEMNARAAALGMTQTVFTNPTGFDISNHHSTAYDMALLSRAAMDDPLCASIVDTPVWNFTRELLIGGSYIQVPWQTNHWFVPPLKSQLSQATGIKGGFTDGAQVTGVYAAQQSGFPWGTVVAGSFGTPQADADAGFLFPEAVELLKLGLDECPNGFVFSPGAFAKAPLLEAAFLPTQTGAASGFSIHAPGAVGDGEDLVIEVHDQVANVAGETTSFQVELVHETALSLDNGETADYRVTGVGGHEGVEFVNTGDVPLNLEVFTNDPQNPEYNLFVDLEETGVIPATMLPQGGSPYTMAVTQFGDEASFTMRTTYLVDLLFDAATNLHLFRVLHDAEFDSELVQLQVIGQDPDLFEFAGLLAYPASEAFLFDPCRASWSNYGTGWPGTNGVPTLTSSTAPVQSTASAVRLGNSTGADASGFLALGLAAKSIPTDFGGTLLVKPVRVLPVFLPQQGVELPWTVPPEPILCGVSFYEQLLVVDPKATDGLAFSRGLRLRMGH